LILGHWHQRFAFAAFLVGICVIMWLFGALSARFGVFPYPALNRAVLDLRDNFVAPDRFYRSDNPFEGVRVADPARVAPGVTLLTTAFPEHDWTPGVRLIDRDGKILHEWPLDYGTIAPGRSKDTNYVHGIYMFPNGDLLFNVEYAGPVRIDRCGKVLWQNREVRGHHSVSPASDGTFWVSGSTVIDDDDAGRAYLKPYKIFGAPLFGDRFVNISADGEVLASISAIEVLDKNGLQQVIAKMARGRTTSRSIAGDVFHLNDVEELSPAMAPAYPMFSAGDLLVSLRQLHLVMVVDPDDLKVKWYDYTTAVSQHDPDFLGDGRIGIFDNNLDYTGDGSFAGGTRIVAVDPVSGATETLYPRSEAGQFFTEYSGKWQHLPNGNLLITSAREGRAFEATPEGEIVWEWASPKFEGTHVPEIMEATRYDIPVETIAGWTCPG
jgi:Arylsulfotransferase (ASST)